MFCHRPRFCKYGVGRERAPLRWPPALPPPALAWALAWARALTGRTVEHRRYGDFILADGIFARMNRPRSLLTAVALAALALSPVSTAAQEPLPESDPATALYRTAQMLESDGEYDLADSLMDYVLRRYPESAAAAAIRTARSASGGRQVEGNGRTELVVWSTLYGLWLGVAIPAMLGAEGSEPYGLGLLVGGPAGFGAAWSATDGVPITDGQAGAITWAGSWGTWQGFGWAHVFDFGHHCPSPVGPRDPATGPASDPASDPVSTTDEDSFCGGGPSSEALFGSMIAGGLIGGAGGIMAARSLDISPGDATLVNLGSLWGTWYGVALGVIADVEGDGLLATTLIAGNMGAGAGAALARAYPVSRTQARIASIIGVVGGLAGAGLDLIIQPDNEKVAMAIPAATSAIGLALGVSRIELGGSGEVLEAGMGGLGAADWSLGGPVFATPVRGPDGERRTAVRMTLLSARF